MGALKSLPKRMREDDGNKNADGGQQIVLFTGSSEKMAILYALRLAADTQKRFKVLVAVSSLSSGENLSDTKVLKYLNTTLFMLQMDISSDEDVRSVVKRITEEDGYLDAVGKPEDLLECAYIIVYLLKYLFSHSGSKLATRFTRENERYRYLDTEYGRLQVVLNYVRDISSGSHN